MGVGIGGWGLKFFSPYDVWVRWVVDMGWDRGLVAAMAYAGG